MSPPPARRTLRSVAVRVALNRPDPTRTEGSTVLECIEPDLVVHRLADVDQDLLAARGIEAVLLDLDNTVCRSGARRPSLPSVRTGSSGPKRFRLAIVSNSIRPRRLNRVAQRLGIAAVGRWGLGRKPLPGGIRAALREVDTPPAAAVIIGDQLFCDVLGGNRLGLYTIWVKPLKAREFAGTKIARMLERLAERRLKRLGLLPEDWR